LNAAGSYLFPGLACGVPQARFADKPLFQLTMVRFALRSQWCTQHFLRATSVRGVAKQKIWVGARRILTASVSFNPPFIAARL
jgi:hypothetical protein